jgi:hypothetical protein
MLLGALMRTIAFMVALGGTFGVLHGLGVPFVLASILAFAVAIGGALIWGQSPEARRAAALQRRDETA